MLKFKTDLFGFDTFKLVRKGWRWIIPFFLMVGFLCLCLSYTHRNLLLERPSSTKLAHRITDDSPRSSTNKAPKTEIVLSASNQRTSHKILPAKPPSAKETSSPAGYNLADDEGVVEEPTEDVFFGYLKLVGTTVSDHNLLKNQAVIEDLVTSQQKLYAPGSVVPYGARIIRIDERGIMLEKDGVKKKLLLSERLGDLADMAVLKSKGYKRTGKREWLITPNCLIEDTEHIYNLLKEASIRPHFDSGRIDGFRVNKIEPGGVIKELGLKVGDVISTVNGRAIDSIAGAYEVYQQIRYAPTIKLGLSRQQREISLAYHIIADGPPKYNVKDVLLSPSITKLFMDK